MAYRNANRPATEKQIAYLRKLILSSAIPASDADRVARYLDSGHACASRVSDGIDWAKGLIDGRDADRDASSDRKAAYHRTPSQARAWERSDVAARLRQPVADRRPLTGNALAEAIDAMYPEPPEPPDAW